MNYMMDIFQYYNLYFEQSTQNIYIGLTNMNGDADMYLIKEKNYLLYKYMTGIPLKLDMNILILEKMIFISRKKNYNTWIFYFIISRIY